MSGVCRGEADRVSVVDMLTLDLVTPDNYEESLALRVAEDQEHLIAPVVNSLADAFVWKAEPRVAKQEGRLVGFVMVFHRVHRTAAGADSHLDVSRERAGPRPVPVNRLQGSDLEAGEVVLWRDVAPS